MAFLSIRCALRAAILAVTILMAGLAGSLLAAPQTDPTPPTERYPFAKGTLERLNLGANVLTIRTSAGARSFEATPQTYVFRGKVRISLDKLKIGEGLKLNYYTNEVGKALVRRIKVDPVDATNAPVRSLDASQ